MYNTYNQFEAWNSVQTAQHQALVNELAIRQALRSAPRNGSARNLITRAINAVRSQFVLGPSTDTAPAGSARA